MWRLSPPSFGRLEEATTLDVRIGGSESNTAVALSRLGLRTAWWSRLPDTPLGRRVSTEIRRWGVDVSAVRWDTSPQARVGSYFLDFGTPPRSTDVFYDRANSSASHFAPEDVDASLIARSRLLHLTGITPALSESCIAAVTHAMQIARDSGAFLSFDVNFRTKLWSAERAKSVLTPLIKGLDLLMCPHADAESVFGLKGTEEEVAEALREKFEVETVVVTCTHGGARAVDAQGAYSCAAYPLGQIVDRVGAGDAFGCGVLMGYLQGDLALGMEYGSAMAALKHTISGDLLLTTRAEVEAVVAGSRGGIRR